MTAACTTFCRPRSGDITAAKLVELVACVEVVMDSPVALCQGLNALLGAANISYRTTESLLSSGVDAVIYAAADNHLTSEAVQRNMCEVLCAIATIESSSRTNDGEVNRCRAVLKGGRAAEVVERARILFPDSPLATHWGSEVLLKVLRS